jgi:hypothetical protein
MNILVSAACHWWVVRDRSCNKLPRGIELIVGRSIFESNIRLANSGGKSLRVATNAKQPDRQLFERFRMSPAEVGRQGCRRRDMSAGSAERQEKCGEVLAEWAARPVNVARLAGHCD